jgi:hypothetical protein
MALRTHSKQKRSNGQTGELLPPGIAGSGKRRQDALLSFYPVAGQAAPIPTP